VTIWTASTPYVCGWTMDDECCTTFASASVTQAQRAVDTAAEVLYGLSGRQFGACERTVRPCRNSCCDPCDAFGGSSDVGFGGLGGYPWVPVFQGGEWINVSCNRCADSCSCTEVCELRLPGPVNSIVEVKLDGNVLAPLNYRVDNHSSLVWLGPDGACWPRCQDMNLADTEIGTFSVTYTRGRPVPAAGRNALAEFACEILKGCTNDASCCLPKRVTTVTRQGITMTLLDPQTFITEGRTGLYMVDAWLRAVNPKARSRYGAIASPDMPAYRETNT
jgi:hypothetical protein